MCVCGFRNLWSAYHHISCHSSPFSSHLLHSTTRTLHLRFHPLRNSNINGCVIVRCLRHSLTCICLYLQFSIAYSPLCMRVHLFWRCEQITANVASVEDTESTTMDDDDGKNTKFVRNKSVSARARQAPHNIIERQRTHEYVAAKAQIYMNWIWCFSLAVWLYIVFICTFVCVLLATSHPIVSCSGDFIFLNFFFRRRRRWCRWACIKVKSKWLYFNTLEFDMYTNTCSALFASFFILFSFILFFVFVFQHFSRVKFYIPLSMLVLHNVWM